MLTDVGEIEGDVTKEDGIDVGFRDGRSDGDILGQFMGTDGRKVGV